MVMIGGRWRRVVQVLFAAVLVAYMTLLVYQFTARAAAAAAASLDGAAPLAAANRRHRLAVAAAAQMDNDITPTRAEIAAPPPMVAAFPDDYNGGGGAGTSEVPAAATATVRPPSTALHDVFISVKTTKHYHTTRLPSILKTWFQLARAQTWFFTDTDDPEFQDKTSGHMINTNCTSSHHRKALCCKMSVEFDTFINTNKKWFCHFDDDNYVNVPRLVRFLGDYNPRDDWYLGKTSIQAPLEIISRDKKPQHHQHQQKQQQQQRVKFWFATGGAGFCLSRALALKMVPVASGGKFISMGEKIRLPDDVTMGYIIEHLLKKPLTVVDQFHSHLEPMKFIRREFLQDQISFSYHTKGRDEKNWNVVKIDGFDLRSDPTRFLSLHCFLFPHFNFCPK